MCIRDRCKYYANQIDTSIHTVIPNYSLVEDNDKDSILQSYETTLDVLDDMHIQYEVFKSAVVNMREDVFYACSYYTEGEGMFWLPLDADYCKINGVFTCLLYTSPSPRDRQKSRMPSSA